MASKSFIVFDLSRAAILFSNAFNFGLTKAPPMNQMATLVLKVHTLWPAFMFGGGGCVDEPAAEPLSPRAAARRCGGGGGGGAAILVVLIPRDRTSAVAALPAAMYIATTGIESITYVRCRPAAAAGD
ncbi:hypothetical protein U9M48_005694 [Paspalum notatum var. saurae]|uniref:Uncharacterized protein n=1 Tax=Paspalum notatum var. saurae TaxID=547442 RepID=A0AAQ3PQQ9_PASNO